MKSVELFLALGLATTLGLSSTVMVDAHEQTSAIEEKDYADQVTADVNNCSTQRVLSEVGLQQALTIAEVFKASAIPIETVTTSEYCRAWATATFY